MSRTLPSLSAAALLLLASCSAPAPKMVELTADQAIEAAESALADGKYQTAVDDFMIAKNQGDHRGELGIGVMYAQGNGELQDFSEARQWLQPAADAGLAEAQYQLGMIEENGGTGVVQDRTKSFVLYSKAAAGGNIPAAYRLGIAYRFGRGTRVDEKEAMRWFMVAAEKDNGDAMTNIGILYLQGRGIAQNLKLARQYFDKGAALGNAESMRQIANMYLEGNGEKQDDGQGYAWLQRAADAGSEQAARRMSTHIPAN